VKLGEVLQLRFPARRLRLPETAVHEPAAVRYDRHGAPARERGSRSATGSIDGVGKPGKRATVPCPAHRIRGLWGREGHDAAPSKRSIAPPSDALAAKSPGRPVEAGLELVPPETGTAQAGNRRHSGGTAAVPSTPRPNDVANRPERNRIGGTERRGPGRASRRADEGEPEPILLWPVPATGEHRPQPVMSARQHAPLIRAARRLGLSVLWSRRRAAASAVIRRRRYGPRCPDAWIP
jgi:hypothetical protein